MATNDSTTPRHTSGISSRAIDAYDEHTKYLSQAYALIYFINHNDNMETANNHQRDNVLWLLQELMEKTQETSKIFLQEVRNG